MTTLTVEDTAIPIIMTSLNQREMLLKLKLQSYRKQLSEFEERYKMSSDEFLNKFLSGQLGDDEYLIEWEFYLDCYKETREQLDQIGSIKL